MTDNLSAIEWVPDISSKLGDLIAKVHPCFKQYRHNTDLFDEYSSDEYGDSIYTTINEGLQCEKEVTFDAQLDIFDDKCEYTNNLWNGCILESDCQPVFDVTLTFIPHDGVYLDGCVNFSYVGRDESSDEYYVIIDGQHIDFSKFVRQQVVELITSNNEREIDNYEETPEYLTLYSHLYDTFLSEMPRAKASDCTAFIFDNLELLSVYDFYRNNPYD